MRVEGFGVASRRRATAPSPIPSERFANSAHPSEGSPAPEREIFIVNLLVRIYFIIVMIRWTGLAPWEFEFHFPGRFANSAHPSEGSPVQWLKDNYFTIRLRLKDLLGAVTRVKKKKKNSAHPSPFKNNYFTEM